MEATRYAIIRDGRVINTVRWDGVSPYSPPEGCTLVLDEEGKASKGGTFDGKTMHPRVRAPAPAPAPSAAEMIADLQARLAALEAKE